MSTLLVVVFMKNEIFHQLKKITVSAVKNEADYSVWRKKDVENFSSSPIQTF
jgi:hypothetical protein